MRTIRRGLCSAAFGSLALAITACAPADREAADTLARAEALFTEETFGGNGRVCSTCHEIDVFGTITPEFVQARWEEDPGDPLFRPIDSDDGLGRSYERLKEHATVRVPMPLDVDSATGLAVRPCEAPSATEFVFNRGNPSVFNAALEELLMVDGREGNDLETQAINAVATHNEPGREPTPEEAVAIADFQRSLFSHEGLRDFLVRRVVLGLPDGDTPSEVRGRTFFQPDRFCGLCHSGPMLNRTSEHHDVLVGARFETVLVGAEPDNPNPKHEWCFVDGETNEIVPGPDGETRVFPGPVADPGHVLLPGVVVTTAPDGTIDTIPNGRLGRLAGPLFKIPTLWGVPDTPPYFHDNSAKTLDEVLEQYNFMFSQFQTFAGVAGCDPEATECLDAQDRADIIAYLQLLAFENRGKSF